MARRSEAGASRRRARSRQTCHRERGDTKQAKGDGLTALTSRPAVEAYDPFSSTDSYWPWSRRNKDFD